MSASPQLQAAEDFPSGESERVALRTLSVLIPVFNERDTVAQLIEQVAAVSIDLELEIVVVDDGSTDSSWNLLCEAADKYANVKVFRHDRNQGKGAAVRTAIAKATGDVAVIQDADLEYDPADYNRLLAPILSGEADAVYGSRFAAGAQRKITRWQRAGNRVLTGFSNLVNRQKLTDMETCYKMIRMDLLRNLRLRSNSFTLEPEITARLAQCGAAIREVPISYRGRTYGEGKKIGFVDVLKACGEIVRSGIWDRQS